MKFHRQSRTQHILMAAVLIAAVVLPIFSYTQSVHAASLSQVFVRFDRMTTSQATTGTVCAKPTTASTEAKVVVTFPAGYTLGAFGTFTVGTTNLAWPTGATAWLGITAPTGAGDISGQSVTFASTDLVVGTLYCFNWTNSAAVSTPSSANPNLTGSVTTQTSAPATIDTAQYATAAISGDQIAVNATVPAAFAFSLSGTTDNFTLSTSSVSTSSPARFGTVSTNAKNGWSVWAKDSNAGLTSSTASYTIPANTYGGSPTTVSAGTNGYVTGVTSAHNGGTGTITVDPGFVGSANTGGGLSTTMRALATSNGTANGDTVTLTNYIAVSSVAPPATDYADTITVIAAGLF